MLSQTTIQPGGQGSSETLTDIDAKLAAEAAGGGVSGVLRSPSGAVLTVKRKNQAVAAAGTDTAVIAAVAGKKIRVLAVDLDCAGTATVFQFNTKPAGAGTIIVGPFNDAISETKNLGYNPQGWFETGVGEGLSATTGAGSTTSVQLVYVEV